jgi:CDP-glycerol glycerophosphotransferase (TagB/SpsB family)/glycosyltransferase involved in cell wall biosynthesis
VYKYSAFVLCNGTGINQLEITTESLRNLAGVSGSPNIAIAYIFDKKQYEMSPELLKIIRESENETDFYLINASKPENLARLNEYTQSRDSQVFFFINEGDIADPYYLLHLEKFYRTYDDVRPVAYVPVLDEGMERLPVGWLPVGLKNSGSEDGLIHLNNSTEKFQPDFAHGLAVWAQDMKDTGFSAERGSKSINELINEAISGNIMSKGVYGRIDAVWHTRSSVCANIKRKGSLAKKFLVSCIVPIYNTEKYLSDAIESVLAQTIGFEENVELILVNDGSTDRSGDICGEYLERYPSNIIYIEQGNKGVSAARNAGLDVASGEYVAFLDSDDRYDSNFFQAGVKFLVKYSDKVDFVAFPLDLFGDVRQGEVHPLDFKFIKTDIIDIEEQPKFVQFHVASVMIRKSVINESCFREDLKYGEDVEFLHRLVMQKGKYGICTDSFLEYRKHRESALKHSENSPGWYNRIETLPEYLTKASLKIRKKVTKYTQECVMYDLQWNTVETISEDVKIQGFRDSLLETVKYLDDEVIKEAKYFSRWQKFHLLSLKYGNPNCEFDCDGDLIIRFGDEFSEKINPLLRLSVVEEYNNLIRISGHFSFFAPEKCNIFVEYGDEKYLGRIAFRNDEFYLGELIHRECLVDIDVPFSANGIIKFFIEIGGIGAASMTLAYDYQCRMRNRKNAFVLGDNTIIRHTSRSNALSVEPLRLEALKHLIESILSVKQQKGSETLLQNYLRMYESMSKRRIWLFMDREHKADDNAEYLFRYCAKIDDNIDKYFVIRENSDDFQRLSEYGKVLAFGSEIHKLTHLFAEKYIAANFDNMYRYPFDGESQYELLKGLCRAEYIFLQHGVTKDDMSPILNRWQRNIKLFSTAGKDEYRSILDGEYGYDESVVKLTGFPRYDNLEIKPSDKKIVFAPTWRKELSVGTAKNLYNPSFKNTEYFKRLSAVLTDKELIDDLENNGFILVFRPHPAVYAQIDDFKPDGRVEVVPNGKSYQETIVESALLITDYSSVAFDFAYLKKPVLYYQFDAGNWRSGYFDYETMGFGEVLSEHCDLAELVKSYINNSCEMSEKYRLRADDFFAYRDKSNCRRVYELIR